MCHCLWENEGMITSGLISLFWFCWTQLLLSHHKWWFTKRRRRINYSWTLGKGIIYSPYFPLYSQRKMFVESSLWAVQGTRWTHLYCTYIKWVPGGTYNTLPPLLSSPPHTVLVIRICEQISWVTTALLGNLHPFIVWYPLSSAMYKKPGIFTPCILWQISLADLSSFNAENPCLKPCMPEIH